MIAMALIVSLLTGVCSGCGTRADTASAGGYYAAAVGMESTPIVDYAVPQLTPNILVDQLGYQAEGRKEAAVKGSSLPKEFTLVDAASHESVYQGIIEKVAYNTETELFVGYADFGEYGKPGTYYLECDGIGRSYTFSIVPDLYGQLFEELCGEVLEKCRQQSADIPEVTELLNAYEWYPGLFGDGNDDGIPDMLEELAKWFRGQEDDMEDLQEGALYAALLAKFSYLYQKYDKQYATVCLQRASAIFEQTQNTIHKDAQSFFALTELYRATGLSTYRNQIADYKSYFENSSSYLEETEYLYGSMTYMVTRQKVDVSLCTTFMEKLMDRGEEVAGRYEDMIHPVSAKNNGTEDIQKRAAELLFANYVLDSYQYHNILEEFLHYLGGRNLQSVCFYSGEGESTGYILLLAQLAASSSAEDDV